jgi:hypothetical protein
VALVRVYCGLASTQAGGDRSDPAGQWLTVAVVDDSGRLLDVCGITDDPAGYVELGAVLAERSGGFASVAVAADHDEHTVTMLLAAAGRALAIADDEDALDDYAERFTDADSSDELAAPVAERRAIGLARALQAGALAATVQGAPRELLALKPVLAAHGALATGRQAAAVALREVLRELYPAALRAYPDPTAPIPLAILDALPEPGLLGGGASNRSRDAHVIAELADTGLADANRISEAVTALRVAISETPRRTGIGKTLTAAVAGTIQQSVAAVRAFDSAIGAVVGLLAEKATPAPAGPPRPEPGVTPLRAVRDVDAPAAPAGGRRAARSLADDAPVVDPLSPFAPPVSGVPAPSHAAPVSGIPAPAAYHAPTHQPPAHQQPAHQQPAHQQPAHQQRAHQQAPYRGPEAPTAPPLPKRPANRDEIAASALPTRPVNRDAAANAAPLPQRPTGRDASGTSEHPLYRTSEQPLYLTGEQPAYRTGEHPAFPGGVPTPRLSPEVAAPGSRHDWPLNPTTQSDRSGEFPLIIDPLSPTSYPTGGFPVNASAQPRRGESRAAEPESRSAEPLTRSAEPLTRSAEPLTRSAEPLSRSAEPLSRSAEPLSRSAEPLSRSAEPLSRPADPLSRQPEPLSRPAEPLPVANGAARSERVTPPWLADDLPAEPTMLRLVEPAPLADPALREGAESTRASRRAAREAEAANSERSYERTGRGAPSLRLIGGSAPVEDESDGDLLIFSQIQSAWFSDVDDAENAPLAWDDNPADEGWLAAEKASDPVHGDSTEVGLPRRVPQANLVPGSPLPAPSQRGLRVVRDPAAMAAHTTGYFRGSRRGEEVRGFSIGGRPGRESDGGWDFSRDGDEREDPYEYRSAARR